MARAQEQEREQEQGQEQGLKEAVPAPLNHLPGSIPGVVTSPQWGAGDESGSGSSSAAFSLARAEKDMRI